MSNADEVLSLVRPGIVIRAKGDGKASIAIHRMAGIPMATIKVEQDKSSLSLEVEGNGPGLVVFLEKLPTEKIDETVVRAVRVLRRTQRAAHGEVVE